MRRLIGRLASIVWARSRSETLKIGVNTNWYDDQQSKHIVRISGALFLIQLARLNFYLQILPAQACPVEISLQTGVCTVGHPVDLSRPLSQLLFALHRDFLADCSPIQRTIVFQTFGICIEQHQNINLTKQHFSQTLLDPKNKCHLDKTLCTFLFQKSIK